MSEIQEEYEIPAETKPLTAEEIEAKLGEPETEFTFEVSQLPGMMLRARILQNATEMVQIHRKSEAFSKLFKKDSKGKQNLPEPLRKFEGVTPEVAQKCALLSEMMLEPLITKTKALEWSKTRGRLLAELVNAVDGGGKVGILTGEVELLEEEKND